MSEADVTLNTEPAEAKVDETVTETETGVSQKRARDDDTAAEENEADDTSKKSKTINGESGADESVANPGAEGTGSELKEAVEETKPAPTPAPAPATYTTAPIENKPSGTTTIAEDGSEIIEVSPDKVGQIIGSKGAIIQDMQQRTGAKIYVNQNFPEGVNRQVSISGTPQQIKAAGDLVRKIITEGPTAIHVNSLAGGPSISISLDCAQNLVGRVIGAGGATIKELQSRTGAKIQIDQNYPEGQPRKINISGTQTSVTMATQLVSYVMENGPTLPPASGMGFGGGGGAGIYGPASAAPVVTATAGGGGQAILECPKNMVGKIIGRGGETINQLQSKSGAKVQIDQNVSPGQNCKIMITGAPQNIAVATQLVQEIMSGRPNMGGGMMGGGGGGYPMQQPQQQMYPGYQQQGGYPGAQGMMQPQFYAQQQQQQQQQLLQQQQMQQYQLQQQQQQQQQQYAGAYSGMAGAAGYQQQAQPQQQAYGAVATGYAAPAAAVAAGKPLPSQWTEHKTDEGNTYWYNSATGVSQWERPT